MQLKEVVSMGIELAQKLRKSIGKSFDVILMDVESFYKNLQPGTVLSGLVMGYTVLHYELSINKAVHRLMDLLTNTDYVYVKRRPRNLSVLARIRSSIERQTNTATT